MLPAASALSAESWVVASLGTVTVMPGARELGRGARDRRARAVSSWVKTRTTVAPPAALPCTSGLLSLAGDAGEVPVRLGAPGALETSV